MTGTPTNMNSSNKIHVHDISYDCPKRELPPQMPTKLPFPATDEPQADIQQYTLDRYRSITFNACTPALASHDRPSHATNG